MTKIDWQKDMKDTMWSMFCIKTNVDVDCIENDKQAIKECVARLLRMATQKTAGQRLAKQDISWDALEHTMMAIVCAAASLALAGEFGEMPKYIEEAD